MTYIIIIIIIIAREEEEDETVSFHPISLHTPHSISVSSAECECQYIYSNNNVWYCIYLPILFYFILCSLSLSLFPYSLELLFYFNIADYINSAFKCLSYVWYDMLDVMCSKFIVMKKIKMELIKSYMRFFLFMLLLRLFCALVWYYY